MRRVSRVLLDRPHLQVAWNSLFSLKSNKPPMPGFCQGLLLILASSPLSEAEAF